MHITTPVSVYIGLGYKSIVSIVFGRHRNGSVNCSTDGKCQNGHCVLEN